VRGCCSASVCDYSSPFAEKQPLGRARAAAHNPGHAAARASRFIARGYAIQKKKELSDAIVQAREGWAA
jgi:hypothetical protein